MASYNESTSELRTNKRLFYDTIADRVLTRSGKTVEEVLADMGDDLGSHTHKANTIIQDENNRFVSDTQINKWTKGPLYTNSNKTIEDIGGVKKGSTFENETVQEVFDKILYPEKGYSFTSSQITYPAEFNVMGAAITTISGHIMISAGSEPISADSCVLITVKSDTINHNNISIQYKIPLTNDIQPGGTKYLPFDINVTSDQSQPEGIIDSDFKLFAKLSGNVEPENYTLETTPIFTGTFVFPYFEGVIAKDINITANNFFSLGLQQGHFSDYKGIYNTKYNCNMQRMVFAVPEVYSVHDYISQLKGNEPTFNIDRIFDQNGLLLTDCFNTTTVEIQVAGHPIRYTIYYSDPCTVENYEISFEWRAL